MLFSGLLLLLPRVSSLHCSCLWGAGQIRPTCHPMRDSRGTKSPGPLLFRMCQPMFTDLQVAKHTACMENFSSETVINASHSSLTQSLRKFSLLQERISATGQSRILTDTPQSSTVITSWSPKHLGWFFLKYFTYLIKVCAAQFSLIYSASFVASILSSCLWQYALCIWPRMRFIILTVQPKWTRTIENTKREREAEREYSSCGLTCPQETMSRVAVPGGTQPDGSYDESLAVFLLFLLPPSLLLP